MPSLHRLVHFAKCYYEQTTKNKDVTYSWQTYLHHVHVILPLLQYLNENQRNKIQSRCILIIVNWAHDDRALFLSYFVVRPRDACPETHAHNMQQWRCHSYHNVILCVICISYCYHSQICYFSALGSARSL